MAATSIAPPRHNPKVIKALRNFAISISVFNIAGYLVLGFEQPWLWPFVALATGYTVEIVLEIIGARAEGRPPRFLGNGFRGLVEFLYPAHITSLAMNMLIYVNDQILVLIFGVCVAVGGKWLFQAPLKGRMRHYMNPSNFGIAAILVLYPWASIAPPYHFTEHLTGPLDWALPALIIVGGTLINGKLTGRMWLILGWVLTFALQAVIRGVILDLSIPGALAMMTGTAFVLFTNYMVTDPGTSPSRPGAQFAFGSGVALVYGLLTGFGIAYGIFFATAIVCLVRGGFLWSLHFVDKARREREAAESAAAEHSAAERETADPTPVAGAPAPSVNGTVTGGKEAVPA
ncbi:enediyne biosynthesis protein [Micromonospora sp. WMMD882]|uniref:enediyne biosynthesis protein n=1 Tax=Micromonospora sp. WMMD882 TaxID=3015151 RepID=UPI00248CE707|nr:enediyne biosynthesis protein [Micromonospora sp. WMMD882]WBB80693.1 enediyne biosynthesis protein [Micromonospora sp. WMMD882]